MSRSNLILHFTGVDNPLLADLALALHEQGASVTCSSQTQHEPIRSKNKGVNPLPVCYPYSEKNVPGNVQQLIASGPLPADHPEVKKAADQGTRVVTIAQFIRQLSEDQQRIVIAGNPGRSAIISFITRVLKASNRTFDYVLSSALQGTRVSLGGAPVILLEGTDEGSMLKGSPDFLEYQHHIGVICGIDGEANGGANEEYVRRFDFFADATPKAGTIIYNEADPMADVICAKDRTDVQTIPYKPHPFTEVKGRLQLTHDGHAYPVTGISKEQLSGVSAAREVLKKIAITADQFFAALQ